MKNKLIIGNWKMNMLPDEAMKFIKELSSSIKNTNNTVALCVPFTDLFYCLMMSQDTSILIGAQNVFYEEKGAYTGEISANMLEPIGVSFVICGHSERRKYFLETNEDVNKKVKTVLKHNMKPIMCIGETLEENSEGKTQIVIENQLIKGLKNIQENKIKDIIIAYEPVWAIGTNQTPTTNQIEDNLKYIRQCLEKLYSKKIAEEVYILYGGSVNSKNFSEILKCRELNGFLVGGASLDINEFKQICNTN